MHHNDNDIKRNGSGYYDPTAYEVLKKDEEDEARFHKLLYMIFDLCELAGFRVEGRIVLEDKKTGRVWR